MRKQLEEDVLKGVLDEDYVEDHLLPIYDRIQDILSGDMEESSDEISSDSDV